LENLFLSWQEFRKGKRKKLDVQIYERHLEDNLFQLHRQLKIQTYHHSHYTSFYISDPKQRHIHKADVEDRIVHHAIYHILYPLFDTSFIFDSYSCRLDKGTHRSVKRLEKFTRIVSQNYTKPCFALKCDIKKFFDSVDHEILFQLIKKKITDIKTLNLIWQIISSYNSNSSPSTSSGFRERERVKEGFRWAISLPNFLPIFISMNLINSLNTN